MLVLDKRVSLLSGFMPLEDAFCAGLFLATALLFQTIRRYARIEPSPKI